MGGNACLTLTWCLSKLIPRHYVIKMVKQSLKNLITAMQYLWS